MYQNESRLQAEFNLALATSTTQLCQGLSTAIARPIVLEEGEFLRFEIFPDGFNINCCAIEEAILPTQWLDALLPEDWYERADEAEADLNTLITLPLVNWFADTWKAVKGPSLYSPAFIFFHGCHLEPFHLEEKRWLSPEEFME